MMKTNEIKALKQAAREEAKLKKQQEREAEKTRKQAIKDAKAAKKAFDKEQMTLYRQRVIAAREAKKLAIENAKQEFINIKKRSYQKYIKSVGYVLMRDRRTIQAVEEIEVEETQVQVEKTKETPILKEPVIPKTVMLPAAVVTKKNKIVPTQSRWENMPHLQKLKKDKNYELLECQGMSTNDYDCARLDDQHMLRRAQSCLHGYHSFEALHACEEYCDYSKVHLEAAKKSYKLLDGTSITRKEMLPGMKYKLINGAVAEC